jgi:hypothetical protein
LFLAGMAAVVGVVPVLVWWLQERAIRTGKVKIPNAGYWLGSARRSATERWLRTHTAVFCIVTTLFLAYVFWLVVQANQVVPPALPAGHIWPALIAYVLSALVWAVVPHVRFRGAGDA